MTKWQWVVKANRPKMCARAYYFVVKNLAFRDRSEMVDSGLIYFEEVSGVRFQGNASPPSRSSFELLGV